MLLDAQFRRVLEQVASAVDAGDAAKDAAKLQPRVAKSELEVRTQNYKIRSQVGSYEARMPVRSTKLLTTVVTNQRSWPRSVMAVTQGEGNVVPQLLTLTQASPRENYKLVSTTPLQPGATFPAIGRAGTETLAPADKSGLLYSGEEALAGLGDRLTKADSTFKDKLVEGKSSPYIADTLAYQADVVKIGRQRQLCLHPQGGSREHRGVPHRRRRRAGPGPTELRVRRHPEGGRGQAHDR